MACAKRRCTGCNFPLLGVIAVIALRLWYEFHSVYLTYQHSNLPITVRNTEIIDDERARLLEAIADGLDAAEIPYSVSDGSLLSVVRGRKIRRDDDIDIRVLASRFEDAVDLFKNNTELETTEVKGGWIQVAFPAGGSQILQRAGIHADLVESNRRGFWGSNYTSFLRSTEFVDLLGVRVRAIKQRKKAMANTYGPTFMRENLQTVVSGAWYNFLSAIQLRPAQKRRVVFRGRPTRTRTQ